ncbi:helicase-related protein [Lysinibacillus sp. NPDC097214]|uniref:helicase-related protein n=1 Tax=Lysinibacillus sp. NPDC097214 TaxID=3390584 RepID=UPI003CFDB16D
MILSSRDALTKEIRKKVDNGVLFNVTVNSYQHIESCIKNKVTDLSPIFANKYDYIVLDECQHFTEGISKYTDLSFKWIMQNSAQKIFMSATAKTLFKYLIDEREVSLENYYYIPKSYEYVDDIYFFNKKADIEYLVDDLMQNTNDKIIVFINSLDACKKLYCKYKDDAVFYCSKFSKDKEALDILNSQSCKIENETFTTRLLISTSALDVGITLKDYSIKHIVASIFNHNQLAQCLGRKRKITKSDKQYIEGLNDTCTYYIRKFNRREMNLIDKSKDLKEMDLFQYDYNQYAIKYGSNREHINKYIFYDFDKNKWEFNELGYMTIKQLQMDLYEMKEKVIGIDRNKNEIKGIGYKRFVVDKLKLPVEKVKEYEVIKQEMQEQTLEQYLESIVGERLLKEQQAELKEVFKKNGLNARTLGINTLNGNLKDRKFPYIILSKRTDKWIDGNSKTITYWEVSNNINH